MDIRETVTTLSGAENVDYDAWEVLHSWLAEHRVDLARVYHGGDPPYPSVATVDERIRRFCRWLQTQDLRADGAAVVPNPSAILCELDDLRDYMKRENPSGLTQELHYIYRLVESDTGAIRYIGRTIDPRERLRQHRNGRCSKAVRSWFTQLQDRGATVRMQIITWTQSATEAHALEMATVRQAILAGNPVLNLV